MIIQAMSGLMSVTGADGGRPTRVGASIGDLIPALYTTTAILAALNVRDRRGGCHLDIGMMDCLVSVMENALSRYWVTGEDPRPLGNRHPAITPFSSFAVDDGEIVIACGNDALWARLCGTLGVADLARDPRFASNSLRTQNATELAVELETALAGHKMSECLDLLSGAGIPCAKINSTSDLMNDPNLASQKHDRRNRSARNWPHARARYAHKGGRLRRRRSEAGSRARRSYARSAERVAGSRFGGA